MRSSFSIGIQLTACFTLKLRRGPRMCHRLAESVFELRGRDCERHEADEEWEFANETTVVFIVGLILSRAGIREKLFGPLLIAPPDAESGMRLVSSSVG